MIRSGGIRDQSGVLSEIAPNFGRFFAIPICFIFFWGGEGFQKLYPRYHPGLPARRLKKFRLKLRLKFFGDLRPPGMCARASLGQSL